MVSFLDHGSGIIIIMAWERGLPARYKNSRQFVKHGRVASVLADNGENLFQVIAEEVGSKLGLPRKHPVDIPAQCVDFSVVDDVAVGMGSLQLGNVIGTVSRMYHGKGGFHLRVGKIGIELFNLTGEQHPIINNRFAGKTRNIKDPLPSSGAYRICFSASFLIT
jgi:hypothetical protein